MKVHDRYSMRLIKYILLGFVLSALIFLSVNSIFGNYYKDSLFVTDEPTIIKLQLNTNDNNELSKILDILKTQSKDRYSILVLNNAKSQDGPQEYNFYSNQRSSSIKDKLITFEAVDYSKSFMIQSGDGILFDPVPDAPIKISNVDFTDISEHAIIHLIDFQDTPPAEVTNLLLAELRANNLSDLLTIEPIDNYLTFLLDIRFFTTKETIYVFLVVSLVAILILKDINNNFKEISLEKLEGISDHELYLKYVITAIITVLLTTILGLIIFTYLRYPVSFNLITKYYHLLLVNVVVSKTSILVMTLAGHYIIKQLKINNALKGFDQLEYSIISLIILKVLVMFIMAVLISNYLTALPILIKGQINYSENLRKYEDTYFINSTTSFDIDYTEEIKRIKPLIPKEHAPYLTVCMPEGDYSDNSGVINVKDYDSIYYIIESDKNLITIDNSRQLTDANKMQFKHFKIDKFEIIEANLKTDDFVYCHERVVPNYSNLYYKDYDMIKIEVVNIYDHVNPPNLLSFKAESLEAANQLIDNIYKETNTDNYLIIESREDNLSFNNHNDKLTLNNIFISITSIVIMMLIVNTELIDNYIKNDREENFSLFLLGKSKLFMLRKYIIVNFLLILTLIFVAAILYLTSSIIISPLMIVMIIIIESISLLMYSRKIEFRKLR